MTDATDAAPSKSEIEAAARRLYSIINAAGNAGASDVHIHPRKGLWLERKGRLRKDTGDASQKITEEELLLWIEASDSDPVIAKGQLNDLGHTSVAFDTGTYRVRASFRHSTVGVSTTFRIIPGGVPTADEMGIPATVQGLVRRPSGLVLVEGPTGSGKSTLIASLVRKINEDYDKHIYTIEDPIEFTHEPIGNTVITQREVGIHAKDYPTSVENALRSKPHVIIVGEMLNPATAKAALHAASTGHLVFTTAHAGTVKEALETFIGQFTADEQPLMRTRLATTLLAVVVQRLIPKVDGGLTAAREILLNNRDYTEQIKVGNLTPVNGTMAGDPQSTTMEQSLAALIMDGSVDIETARDESRDLNALDEQLRALGFRA